ncbi:GAF domain-containing sensor histidine kinase [Paracoccus sp. 1_MG-2023]|uniref:GAF domain-containing sensor histidine kinase n=1 Tax=unclassified Paracoccus (in: a-proteobacteria) TaxID=2688777 RepID=UPI001C091FDF|nr:MULTISPECIES: GAF domain-containing sensor histidine kinase [unclassified Paracoccus (in: a-proteobacteria)]MBU2958488.1 GAF domain-containing sensor histidine kinase [Paracoccus sp. C2R09]MDO6668527.1 GAF domain-containing sensor histidine kinase [Paracoccus sp. 1_MG-2023]
MQGDTPPRLQDRAAFASGQHDFQSDIETLSQSQTIRTILETVMLATEMRFAAVARVTEDRWVACRTVDELDFDLVAGDEIEIQSTFCQQVREAACKVVFDDADSDPAYRGHAVVERFGIVSYASFPIHRSDGSFFGTLCALDSCPRDVSNPRAIAMMEMFADLIGRNLETEEQLEAQKIALQHERELARLQEEFVAILGHDLRNPVAAFHAGLRQLNREPQSENAAVLLPLMQSSVHRMNELINNMMLHATDRLGGGIRVTRSENAPLAQTILQIVEELRIASPDREILSDLALDGPVACDAQRIGQAISNLLSNALTHGQENTPVELSGRMDKAGIVITVRNRGRDIPEDIRRNLFRPFHRGPAAGGQGLGLGLHVAASVVAAHGGAIEVTSDQGLTEFTLRLPH